MWALRQGLSWLLQQLLPPACPLCRQTFPAAWAAPLCAGCLAGISPLPAAHCTCCALPFTATAGSAHLCGRCLKQPPGFNKVFALGLFSGTLRDAIHQLKFSQRVSLDRPLARLLTEKIPANSAFDLIVPVPLHRLKLQRRSYNQALLLARELGRCRDLPVAVRLLNKTVDTPPQQDLSAAERWQNLKQVFRVEQQLQGEKILLVDDVLTTGATVRSCSQALLTAGAAEVQVAVLARA